MTTLYGRMPTKIGEKWKYLGVVRSLEVGRAFPTARHGEEK